LIQAISSFSARAISLRRNEPRVWMPYGACKTKRRAGPLFHPSDPGTFPKNPAFHFHSG
jgi:hypothetical protein